MKKKYYVEFVGQHGAGKSTTYRYLVDNKLLSDVVSVYPHLLGKRSRLRFFLLLPFIFLTLWRDWVFLIHFAWRYTSVSVWNCREVYLYLIKMLILHKYYQLTYTFDVWYKQDMLHLLPRLRWRSGVSPELAFASFFHHFKSRYNGIVFIDIDWREVEKRYWAKRYLYLSQEERKERLEMYRYAYSQQNYMKEVLLKQDEVPVLVLDGFEDVTVKAKCVADFILNKVLK